MRVKECLVGVKEGENTEKSLVSGVVEFQIWQVDIFLGKDKIESLVIYVDFGISGC